MCLASQMHRSEVTTSVCHLLFTPYRRNATSLDHSVQCKLLQIQTKIRSEMILNDNKDIVLYYSVRRMVDVGLVEHYLRVSLDIKRVHRETISSVRPFTPENLKGHFMILGVGLACSFVVKLIERICTKLFTVSRGRRGHRLRRPGKEPHLDSLQPMARTIPFDLTLRYSRHLADFRASNSTSVSHFLP